MSRDKQIEEMAWLKCCCHSNKGMCSMDGKPCDLDCGSYHEAKALYNAGYRKSTVLAEEIFAEMESTIKGIIVLLSFSYNDSPKESYLKKACYKDMLGYIAELKKKYTEGGE